jgi:hypothetical protein
VSNLGIGIQVEILMLSHQVTGLWVVFGPLVQKIGVVRWGKISSSCRVVRVVFSRRQLGCSSATTLFGQLLLPARLSNSALNAALCPGYWLWDPPTALLWEVNFPFLAFRTLPPLLGASCSSRQLAYQCTSALNLCCFKRAWFLATPQTDQQWEMALCPSLIL